MGTGAFMKITKLTTFVVPPRWLFLKLETDAGITGWGEPVVEGRAALPKRIATRVRPPTNRSRP